MHARKNSMLKRALISLIVAHLILSGALAKPAKLSDEPAASRADEPFTSGMQSDNDKQPASHGTPISGHLSLNSFQLDPINPYLKLHKLGSLRRRPMRRWPSSTQSFISSNTAHQQQQPQLQHQQVDSNQVTCNDGSPPGYYRRLNSFSKSWIIYLQGGGFCTSEATCKLRFMRTPQLMSSNQWPRTRTVEGILSSDPKENPYLWNANHIYVPYCSSDAWSGLAPAKNSSSFAFMGSRILERVIDSLYEELPRESSLYEAKYILLAGDSAGATGVILNLDRVNALIDKKTSPSNSVNTNTNNKNNNNTPFMTATGNVVSSTTSPLSKYGSPTGPVHLPEHGHNNQQQQQLQHANNQRHQHHTTQQINLARQQLYQLHYSAQQLYQKQHNSANHQNQRPVLRGLADSGWFLDNEPYDWNEDAHLLGTSGYVSHNSAVMSGFVAPVASASTSAYADSTDATQQIATVNSETFNGSQQISSSQSSEPNDEDCDHARCGPIQAIRPAMKLWNGQVPDACAAQFPAEQWRCYFGYRAYQTLKTPLFVVQWLYDEAQLLADNIARPDTNNQWDYVNKVVTEMRDSLRNVSALFAPSCFSHSLVIRSSWNKININGFKLPHVLNSWEEQFLSDTNNNSNPNANSNSNMQDDFNGSQSIVVSSIETTRADARWTHHSGSDTSIGRLGGFVIEQQKSVASTDRFRFIDNCGWPQCNRDCPVLDFDLLPPRLIQF